jgi:hypothetical protein
MKTTLLKVIELVRCKAEILTEENVLLSMIRLFFYLSMCSIFQPCALEMKFFLAMPCLLLVRGLYIWLLLDKTPSVFF